MRAAVVVLVAFTGCQWVFSPSTDPDGTAIDAPGTDAIDADPTQPDADPTRPDAAPCAGGGPDEDADGFPDTCDFCPHLSSSQQDGDGDGVGTTCDPHPILPVDAIAEFVSFAAGDPVGWSQEGQWMVGGGRLTALGDEATTSRYYRTLLVDGPGLFEAELRLPAAPQGAIVGLEIQRDGLSAQPTMLCAVEDTGAGTPHVKVYYVEAGTLQDRTVGDGPEQPRGAAFTLRARYELVGGTPTVTCEHDGVPVESTPPALLDTRLGGVGFMLATLEDAPTVEIAWGVLITTGGI
jgi:hypothetical protein